MENREQLRQTENVVENDSNDRSRNNLRGEETGEYKSKENFSTEEENLETKEETKKTHREESDEFDKTISEPFFESIENQNHIKSYFGGGLEKRKTEKQDKEGADYFFTNKNGFKRAIDLKTKFVDLAHFDFPSIEISLFKTKVDKNNNLRFFGEDSNNVLFDDYFMQHNLTNYYVYNLITAESKKNIKTPEDILANKLYIFNKRSAYSYFEKFIGSKEEILNKSYELYDEIRREENSEKKYPRKYLKRGVSLLIRKDEDNPKIYKISFSFSPRLISFFSRGKKYEYVNEEKIKILKEMGLEKEYLNEEKENE